MGKQYEDEDDEDMFVTVYLDNGDEMECQVLTIYEANKQDYVALLPVDENENPIEDADVYIYRYHEDENGDPILENIETDEEWEIASDRFDEYLDELEFEELNNED